jgi:hypothetical protein
MRIVSAMTIVVLAAGCASENVAERSDRGLISPNGRASARVTQIANVTQVFIAFDGGRCGSGSVSTLTPNPDIVLSWRDSTTLVVSVPKQLALMPAPAERQLDHRAQCSSDVVDVVVRGR